MLERLFHKVYYFIIPLLILGITYKYTTFAVALIAFIPLVLMTNRHTIGIFLLMYGGPLGGVIRAMYPSLPIYGLLLEALGVVLLYDLLAELFRINTRALLAMGVTLVLFGFFYEIGPRDDWAQTKYTNMCIHGIMMVLGYFAFNKSKKIDAEGMLRILFVASICMFCYVIYELKIIPGALFDYNWFREQQLYFERLNDHEAVTVVGYQHIGLFVLFGLAIYLSQIKLKTEQALFYILCGAQLVLMSGCRQAIVGVSLVIVLRLVVFRTSNLQNNNKIGRLVWMVVLLLAIYALFIQIFENIGSIVMSKTLTEGDEGRSIRWLAAISIFQDNLFIGGGIGRYHALTGYQWPHNFFLELLSETGIVGTILFLSLLIVPLIQKKTGILYISASNQFFFLILSGIFVRVMVSSDFRESIELFSAVFAISATRLLLTQKKIKAFLSNKEHTTI